MIKMSATILGVIIVGFSSVALAKDFYCHDGSKLTISAFNNEIALIKHGVEYKGTRNNNEVNWGDTPREVGLPKRVQVIVLGLSPQPGVVFTDGLTCDLKINPKESGAK